MAGRHPKRMIIILHQSQFACSLHCEGLCGRGKREGGVRRGSTPSRWQKSAVADAGAFCFLGQPDQCSNVLSKESAGSQDSLEICHCCKGHACNLCTRAGAREGSKPSGVSRLHSMMAHPKTCQAMRWPCRVSDCL